MSDAIPPRTVRRPRVGRDDPPIRAGVKAYQATMRVLAKGLYDVALDARDRLVLLDPTTGAVAADFWGAFCPEEAV